MTISDLAGNSAFDLLDSCKPLSVLEDSSGEVHLSGITEHHLHSSQQALDLLEQAASFRRTESTKKNDTSSRSHSICCLRIRKTGMDDGILYLVDLAGSEAARDIAEHGADRMRETKEINTSLSVLKDCLRAKAEIDIARQQGREKKLHVPTRRSTLTRVFSSRRVKMTGSMVVLRPGTDEGSCVFTKRCVKKYLRNVFVFATSGSLE